MGLSILLGKLFYMLPSVLVMHRYSLSTGGFNEVLLMYIFLCLSTILILSFSLSIWRSRRKYIQMNERYKLLVENSMDAIALIKQGRWEYMNPSGLRLFEANSDRELFGSSIYQLLDKQHHLEVTRFLESGHDGEEVPTQPMELQWRTLTGARLYTEWVRVRTTFLGSPIEQVIIRDISERKKNETQLIISEKLAIAGQLAAGIAHEIRNPLTSLKVFLQLMESGRIHDKRYFKIMKSEVVLIESIVSGLLMMSKPQAYDYSYTDASQLMRDSIELLEPQANLYNVRFEYKAEQQPMWVKGVEDQLRQGFFNVLENAIESMQNGGRVRIDLCLDSDFNVRIRIKDEGAGLSEEQISKIGQPFYTTKDKGTGLGLMVTYKIIANHQGHISAESEIGIGTTFTIRLPYSCPADSSRMLEDQHA